MTHFCVGEKVVIRYGTQQGQMATILKTLPADGYKVKLEAGLICFYSGKGLVAEKEGLPKVTS